MRNSPDLRRSPPGDARACGIRARLARPGGTLLAVLPVNGGAERMAIVSFLLPAQPAPGPASAIPARSAGPVAAIQAVRSMPDAAGTTGDGLVLDPASRRVLADGRDTGLAYLQFDLLHFLMRHAGRAFTRRQLFAAVWRDGADEASRSVDIHIHRIRRKLGPEYSRRLVTVRRVGYLYQQPAAS
jgi:DNA-binding response OmpR family regulator